MPSCLHTAGSYIDRHLCCLRKSHRRHRWFLLHLIVILLGLGRILIFGLL